MLFRTIFCVQPWCVICGAYSRAAFINFQQAGGGGVYSRAAFIQIFHPRTKFTLAERACARYMHT